MADSLHVQLAHIILRHRKAAGLSQKELGDLAGVGKTVIYDLEHEKRSVKLETLLKVLHALNIKIAFTSPLKDISNEQ